MDEGGSSNNLLTTTRTLSDKDTASPLLTPRVSAIGMCSSFDTLHDMDADEDAARGFPLSDEFMSNMIIRHAAR